MASESGTALPPRGNQESVMAGSVNKVILVGNLGRDAEGRVEERVT